MGAFKYDNPLINAMIRAANLMIVSFFWLLCSLPIVTLLPASAALYHTVAKVIHGSGSGVARDYFKSFAGACRRGIPLSLLSAGMGALLAYALYIGWQAKEKSYLGAGYFFVGILLAFLFLAAVLHMVPALARFEGGLGMYLRMGLYFAGKNFLRTALRLLLLALVVLLVDFYPVVLLILPGVYMDLVAPGLEKLVMAFMEENGLEEPGEETEEEQTDGERSPTMPSIEMDRLLSDEGEEDRDE